MSLNVIKQLSDMREMINENSNLMKYIDSVHARLEKLNEQMDVLILEIKENNAAIRAWMTIPCTKEKIENSK